MKNSHLKDFAGVVSFAPILLLIGLAISLVAYYFAPIKILTDNLGQNILLIIGIIAVIIGTLIIFWAQSISRGKVHINEKPALADFLNGPYKYSRHPGTLGLLILFGGFSFIVNSLVMVAIGIIFLLLMTMWFAPAEENFMIESCGESYQEYQKQVRMWI